MLPRIKHQSKEESVMKKLFPFVALLVVISMLAGCAAEPETIVETVVVEVEKEVEKVVTEVV